MMNFKVKSCFICYLIIASTSIQASIDFSKSGMQPLSEKTVRIRNIIVNGKRYYGDFRWNGQELKLVSYGKDNVPMITITNRSYILSKGAPTNLVQACMREFGSFSRVADYWDLKGVAADNMNLDALVAELEENGDKFFLTYGISLRDANNNPYFATTKLIRDNRNLRYVNDIGGMIDIYASKNRITGKVICINNIR